MDDLVRVPVPTETLAPDGTTNAYVVGTDGAILVDPATRTPTLDQEVHRRDVAHVLLTHTHPDHVGAVAHYAETTGATVWARANRAARFARATGVEPDWTFREGDTLRTDDGLDVQLLDTPGHASDHVSLSIPGVGMLVGDLAVAEGSVMVDPEEGDMRAYLTSLRRLHAMDPPTLYPGHGPVIDDPRPTLSRLIRHRLAREAKVVAAVRGGARTPDEIVDAVYEKDISGVREFARRTVVAHLQKSAVERAVAWDGQRARPPADSEGE